MRPSQINFVVVPALTVIPSEVEESRLGTIRIRQGNPELPAAFATGSLDVARDDGNFDEIS